MAPTVLALCAGVGGLELGVRIACPGARLVCAVERDAYAAAVLLARMEDAALDPAPVWCGDLADLDCAPFAGRVDLVTAGFPCQPWSCAGKREGQDDERWLWPGIARIVREVRPGAVFLENVPGLVSGGGLEPVLGDLAALGFDAEWQTLRASEVGAPHRRERVFVLAYRVRERLQGLLAGGAEAVATGRGGGAEVADADARRLALERLAERSGEQGACGGEPVGCGDDGGQQGAEGLADPGDGLVPLAGRGPEARDGAGSAGAESVDDAVRYGPLLPHDEVRAGRHAAFPPGPDGDWSGVPEWLWPAVEPGVCDMADEPAGFLDYRADRLRALGNGCLPLQAATALVLLARRALT